MDGETLMKNKKISKNMFKALEDSGYFDIGISDELEDTEEIDIAGQWGTFVKPYWKVA